MNNTSKGFLISLNPNHHIPGRVSKKRQIIILTILNLDGLKIGGEGFLQTVTFVHDLSFFTSQLSSSQSVTGVLPDLASHLLLLQGAATGSWNGWVQQILNSLIYTQ